MDTYKSTPAQTLTRYGRSIALHLLGLVRHIENWVEGYLWVPLLLFCVWGAGQLDYFLTGRRPMTNADWLVDYSSVAVKSILVILFAAILKQSGSIFLTKEERFKHPFLSMVSDLFTLGAACFFGYLFTR